MVRLSIPSTLKYQESTPICYIQKVNILGSTPVQGVSLDWKELTNLYAFKIEPYWVFCFKRREKKQALSF
ncbi:hypothetical protein DNU06_14275 [Putridiphycobacter roseus]|uniref:Uncharacterized protein n=1 Tax=Putridiphycobacter roseus TaxID=2219161 RepID=A0A2W1MY65_9FLAO|nr:hypothetical protein DNU06_14275 [Putridiphycobacter roseus]